MQQPSMAMLRPIAALFCLSCLVDVVALVAAQELHVLNSTVLNCSAAHTACSSTATKPWALQADVLTIYENDGSGSSSRQISYRPSDLPQVPGLVEWVQGKQRRLVGSTPRHGAGGGGGSSKGERAVIGTDDRFHPAMGDPYDKIGKLVRNSGGFCTASLVYRNLILTNAHCVLDDFFQWETLSDFTFYLGYESGSALAEAKVNKGWVSPEYFSMQGCETNCNYSDKDWALLRLDKPLGAQWGYLPILEFGPDDMQSCESCENGMELAGYSADPACLQGKKLCTDSSCSLLDSIVINVCFKTGLGPLCNFGVNYGAHDCDTQKGASGSALITNNGTHDIYALHASSSSIKGVTFPVFETLPSLAKANKAIWTQVFFQYVLDQSTLEAADLGNHRHSAIFISELPFSGSGSLDGFTNDDPTGEGADVFYYYVPTSTVHTVISTCGSSFETMIAIYEWTEGQLVLKPANDSPPIVCGSGFQTLVEFTFVAGEEYFIVLDGISPSSFGDYSISILQTPPKGNVAGDAIIVQNPLPYDDIGSTAAYNDNFTSLGEGPDVFYRLTTEFPVSVVISTCGSSFDTLVGVYMDLGQYNFALISSNDDSEECGSGQQSQLEVILQPETDYLIVLDGHSESDFGEYQITMTANWTLVPGDAPSSALFVDLVFPLALTATTLGLANYATLGNGSDAFYRVTFDQTKAVCIDTCGSSFDTILGIYEDAGTAAGALLASNDDFSTCGEQSMIEFVFQAGTSYLMVVDGKSAEGDGPFNLTFRRLGDEPDIAIRLPSAISVQTTGDLTGFGNFMELGAGADVVYKYSSPTSLSISLDACGSSFDALIAIATTAAGDKLLAATPSSSAASMQACPDGTFQSRVTHDFEGGSEYFIILGGSSANASGPFVLTLRPTLCGDRPIVSLDNEETTVLAVDEYLLANSLPLSTALCVIGTDSADTITGGPANDVIFGLGGDDILSGGQGKDTIYGGAGADSIAGGKGKDIIWGQADHDSLKGGPGRDQIYGGGGKDIINGSSGKDTLSGGIGADIIYACGKDTVLSPLTAKDSIIAC